MTAQEPSKKTRKRSTKSYPCPVDGRPCEVTGELAALMDESDPSYARQIPSLLPLLADLLPCQRCRLAHDHARKLNNVRLGKHERNILLYAPRPDALRGAIIDPSLKTHSERETYLRAVRKLGRAGLVRIGTRTMRVETQGVRSDGSSISRSYKHRTLWLTPLGVEVVNCYRAELESGRAIRWSKHIDDLVQAVRLPLDELLPELEQALAFATARVDTTEASAGTTQLQELLTRLKEAKSESESSSGEDSDDHEQVEADDDHH